MARGRAEGVEAAGEGSGGGRRRGDSGELSDHGSEVGGVGGDDGGGSTP